MENEKKPTRSSPLRSDPTAPAVTHLSNQLHKTNCPSRAPLPFDLMCEAVSQLNEGALITDDDVNWPAPSIVYANAAMYTMTGYTAQELQGQTPDLFHGDLTDQATLARIQSDLHAGLAALTRLTIFRKDRTPVDVEVFIAPLFDNQGHRTNFLAIFRDLTHEKQIEQTIRTNETRYQMSIELTGRLAWTTNRFGEVEEDCPIWRKFTGFSFAETKGLGWTKAIHPDDVDAVLQAWNKSNSEQTRCEAEFRLRRFDGTYRSFMSRAVLLVQQEGAVYEWFWISTDITDRKKTESRIAEDLDAMTRLHHLGTLSVSDGSLPSVLQAVVDAAVAIAKSDFGTIQLLDSKTGRLQVVAHRGFPDGWLSSCRVLPEGNCPACIVQRKCVFIADVEQCPNFIGTKELEVMRQVNVRSVLCTPLISRSGEVLGIFSTHFKTPNQPDDWSLKYIELLARQAADGIEHQLAADALRDREERLLAVLDTACDAIITIDQRGIIVSANPATDRLFGYSPNELVGQNVSILMPAPYREEHDCYLHRYLDTGNAQIIGKGREVMAQRKDGATFPVDLNISQIPHLRLFTGIIRDISERKNLQRDILAIAEDERRRIGQDLHDSVQQELAAVGMVTQALLKRLESGSNGLPTEVVTSCRELGRSIQGGLNRAHQELRVISRGLVPFSLHTNGLMEALRDLALRTDGLDGISCAFKCEQPASVTDSSKATHLYRIAQEAVTNSLRHARAEHILIELEIDASNLVLRVADDGTGIINEIATSGMGLKTMRYRASLIGGSLSVMPVDRGGTLVTCTVPG